MGLVAFAVCLALAWAALNVRPSNITWRNVALFVLALGALFFGFVGSCSLLGMAQGQGIKDDYLGLNSLVWGIGLGSVVVAIACTIGALRNR